MTRKIFGLICVNEKHPLKVLAAKI